MTDKTYEQGVHDGKIEAIETTLARHSARMDNHSTRIRTMEKVMWMLMGAIFVINILPGVIDLFGRFN